MQTEQQQAGGTVLTTALAQKKQAAAPWALRASAPDCWRSRLAARVLRVLRPAARAPPFRPPEKAPGRVAHKRSWACCWP